MPSRRAHTKSRLGCIQCKARRVKCDQTYPTCNNCVRHEKSCVYGQVSAGTPSTVSKVPSGGSADDGVAAPVNGPRFDSLDMMLMHHFCTATSTSLSASPKAQEVWRDVIPIYAHTNHMLLHGILTLAANHYVHVNKSKSDSVTMHDYRTRALYHSQLGLQIFRHQVQNSSEDQSHELLLTFAAMLGILTFAEASTEKQALTFEDALSMLAVLRGKQALWRAGSGMSLDSKLAPAFFDMPPQECRADLSSTVLALGELHATTQNDIHRRSITALKAMAESQTSSEFRMLGTWPAGLSDDFLHLLKLRDGIALRTFEHYCTIVESMSRLWWVGDLGQRLKTAIRASV